MYPLLSNPRIIYYKKNIWIPLLFVLQNDELPQELYLLDITKFSNVELR